MLYSQRLKSVIGHVFLATIFTAIGITGALTYTNYSAVKTASNDHTPTYQALSILDSALSRLYDSEAAVTASTYITQETPLVSYRAAIQDIHHQVDAIRTLVSVQPEQQDRFAVLERLIDQRLNLSAQLVEARQGNDGTAEGQALGIGKINELMEHIRKSLSAIQETEKSLVAQHNSSVYLHQRNAVLSIVAGSLLCIILAMGYHLFMRRQAAFHRRDQATLKKLLVTVEQSSDLVVVTDKGGVIEYVNKAVETVSGYGTAELIGKNRDLWKSGKQAEKFFTRMQDSLEAGLPFSGVAVYRAKNGELFYLEETVTPFRDDEGKITHIISTGKDVTRQKNLKEKLDYLSHFDALTGIPNRILFSDRLEQGISRSHTMAGSIAVLIIDIDRFKLVNDVFGFSAGNDTLRAITERLTSTVSGGDTVARIGNDEFGILINGVVNASDIHSIVERIMKNVREPIMLRGEEIVLSLAVGIAVYPDDGKDAETLMRNAHIALSKAKGEGRNNYQFFTENSTQQASEIMFMEKRLYSALQNEEYQINYQPYVDMTTRRVGGAEALIAWKSDKHGLVSPSKFIPMLEDSGMIIEVGEWVLRTACRQIREWDRGAMQFPVAVNLSLSQLRHKDLISMVHQTISEFGIEPSHLTLEVTESMCIYDLNFASVILKKLKDLGVSISIDDFGTGYSSLSYLKKLPVDNVKIDMSFVNDITTDPDAASIVSAITSLARNLNLKTIAEGVETEEQWRILRLLRCDMGQGFYFSPAIPAQAISKFASRTP